MAASELRGQELIEYIFNQPQNIRDQIEKEVTDALLLDDMLSSGGKLILDSAFDLMTKNVLAIIRNCSEEKPDGELIRERAKEIAITYGLVLTWGKILKRGFDHIEKAEKK